MNQSIQPKQDFLKDTKAASEHADTMASPLFRVAAKTALLQMQYQGSMLGDVQLSATSYIKLKGAQEFLHILLNLGNPEKPITEKQEQHLNPV